LLGDMNLLRGLREFDINTVRGEMSKKVKSKMKELKKSLGGAEGSELNAAIKSKSSSAAGLFKWAAATDEYYDIFREVEPKKKLAEKM